MSAHEQPWVSGQDSQIIYSRLCEWIPKQSVLVISITCELPQSFPVYQVIAGSQCEYGLFTLILFPTDSTILTGLCHGRV